MLKINGSAVDNHPHPPLFCAAVADRLVQLFTPVLISRMAHMVLSEKTQSCSLINTQMHTSQSFTRNLVHAQINKACEQSPPGHVMQKSRQSNVPYEGSTHTVKAAFTQIYFILLFPPSSPLYSPVLQISCTSFSLSSLCGHNSLWSGFLTSVQIGKLQDGELSLVRFMWSQGACGRWGVGEVLVVGVGQSKEDISPTCSGLTLLTLTA